MTSSVILKKKSSKDTFGYLSIRYFNGSGVKKVISLSERLNEIDFIKFFDSEFNLFKKTTLIDYKALNKKISEKLNDFTIFDIKIPLKNYTKSFITYFTNHLDTISNPATRQTYIYTLKKLEQFKEYKKYNDILFTQIDRPFVIELKDYLLLSTSGSSTKQYLTIIKIVLNISKQDDLYFEKWNYFSKLNIATTYTNKKILTERDIQTLLEMTPYINLPDLKNKHFETRTMLLFSLLCSGLRVSDLMLVRNKDFKKDYIEVITKKTSLSMRIPYNDKLIGLLLDIYGLYDSTMPMGTGYYGAIHLYTDIEARKTRNKDYNKEKILKHISSLPKEDFMFKAFLSSEPSLNNFDKLKEMTLEQNTSMNNIRTKYNYSLKEMIKIFDFDIENISSHSGRYSWTNLLLNIEGVNLIDIKRSLGHKRLSTTENYIEKNFSLEKLENIGNKLSDKLQADIEI